MVVWYTWGKILAIYFLPCFDKVRCFSSLVRASLGWLEARVVDGCGSFCSRWQRGASFSTRILFIEGGIIERRFPLEGKYKDMKTNLNGESFGEILVEVSHKTEAWWTRWRVKISTYQRVLIWYNNEAEFYLKKRKDKDFIIENYHQHSTLVLYHVEIIEGLCDFRTLNICCYNKWSYELYIERLQTATVG